MNNEKVIMTINDIEVIDTKDYKENLEDLFLDCPTSAKSLLINTKKHMRKFKDLLSITPAFIELVKSYIPKEALQAVLTDEQKAKIASGALKIMTKKDGTFLATLINPSTKEIVKNIPLEKVKGCTEVSKSLSNLSSQIQMMQIAEEMHNISESISMIQKGQENDRLAVAYSCQQKLYQTLQIQNEKLKTMALLQVISDAEDSRNLLMLSQKENLKFIESQPENFFSKVFSGSSQSKIEQTLNDVYVSLSAINKVSLIEGLAYQELNENAAARQSLIYYSDFLKNEFINKPKFMERIQYMLPEEQAGWTKNLDCLVTNIEKLPCYEELLLEEL